MIFCVRWFRKNRFLYIRLRYNFLILFDASLMNLRSLFLLLLILFILLLDLFTFCFCFIFCFFWSIVRSCRGIVGHLFFLYIELLNIDLLQSLWLRWMSLLTLLLLLLFFFINLLCCKYWLLPLTNLGSHIRSNIFWKILFLFFFLLFFFRSFLSFLPLFLLILLKGSKMLLLFTMFLYWLSCLFILFGFFSIISDLLWKVL